MSLYTKSEDTYIWVTLEIYVYILCINALTAYPFILNILLFFLGFKFYTVSGCTWGNGKEKKRIGAREEKGSGKEK